MADKPLGSRLQHYREFNEVVYGEELVIETLEYLVYAANLIVVLLFIIILAIVVLITQ